MDGSEPVELPQVDTVFDKECPLLFVLPLRPYLDVDLRGPSYRRIKVLKLEEFEVKILLEYTLAKATEITSRDPGASSYSRALDDFATVYRIFFPVDPKLKEHIGRPALDRILQPLLSNGRSRIRED